MAWHDYLFEVEDSSVIDYLGYSTVNRRLYVSVKKRIPRGEGFFHAYVYTDVPDSEFQSILTAGSKGHYFSKHIRDNYGFYEGTLLELNFNLDCLYRNNPTVGHLVGGFPKYDVQAFSSVSCNCTMTYYDPSVGNVHFAGFGALYECFIVVPPYYPRAIPFSMTPVEYYPQIQDNLYVIRAFDASTYVGGGIPCRPARFFYSSVVNSILINEILFGLGSEIRNPNTVIHLGLSSVLPV